MFTCCGFVPMCSTTLPRLANMQQCRAANMRYHKCWDSLTLNKRERKTFSNLLNSNHNLSSLVIICHVPGVPPLALSLRLLSLKGRGSPHPLGTNAGCFNNLISLPRVRIGLLPGLNTRAGRLLNRQFNYL